MAELVARDSLVAMIKIRAEVDSITESIQRIEKLGGNFSSTGTYSNKIVGNSIIAEVRTSRPKSFHPVEIRLDSDSEVDWSVAIEIANIEKIDMVLHLGVGVEENSWSSVVEPKVVPAEGTVTYHFYIPKWAISLSDKMIIAGMQSACLRFHWYHEASLVLPVPPEPAVAESGQAEKRDGGKKSRK